jgi:hypothetical protein
LNNACCGFAKRRKALAHHGTLGFDSDPRDTFEWITIGIRPLVGPALILQLAEQNWVSLYLRSRRRENRGKVLLAIEGLTVADNAQSLVATVEWTMTMSLKYTDQTPNQVVSDEISARWRRLAIRRVEDPSVGP